MRSISARAAASAGSESISRLDVFQCRVKAPPADGHKLHRPCGIAAVRLVIDEQLRTGVVCPQRLAGQRVETFPHCRFVRVLLPLAATGPDQRNHAALSAPWNDASQKMLRKPYRGS